MPRRLPGPHGSDVFGSDDSSESAVELRPPNLDHDATPATAAAPPDPPAGNTSDTTTATPLQEEDLQAQLLREYEHEIAETTSRYQQLLLQSVRRQEQQQQRKRQRTETATKEVQTVQSGLEATGCSASDTAANAVSNTSVPEPDGTAKFDPGEVAGGEPEGNNTVGDVPVAVEEAEAEVDAASCSEDSVVYHTHSSGSPVPSENGWTSIRGANGKPTTTKSVGVQVRIAAGETIVAGAAADPVPSHNRRQRRREGGRVAAAASPVRPRPPPDAPRRQRRRRGRARVRRLPPAIHKRRRKRRLRSAGGRAGLDGHARSFDDRAVAPSVGARRPA